MMANSKGLFQALWTSLTLAIMCLEISTVTSKLIHVKSNKMTGPEDVVQVSRDQNRKVKRSRFSRSGERELLDLHNKLRRQEGSSDMELLVWNDYLASMAEDWAQGCVWAHGQPYRDPDTLPFKNIGQNLYAYNGTFNASVGIQIFYDEKEYYDYETGACSKPPCGHYTQVVWSGSKEVGCAYNKCPTLGNIDLIKSTYLVCNYGPSGNWKGEKPFRKGAACTQCGSGQGWCQDGLCTDACPSQEPNCECKAQCHNCGEVTSDDCSCKCAVGWTGPDCSEVCEDTHEWCGANPGWPTSWCDRNYVIDNCPALCQICTPGHIECTTTTAKSTTSIVTRGGGNESGSSFPGRGIAIYPTAGHTESTTTTAKSTTSIVTRGGGNESGSSFPGWGIAIIVVFLLTVIIVAAVLIVYFPLKRRRNPAPAKYSRGPALPRRPAPTVPGPKKAGPSYVNSGFI